jgi:hypothetical protein
MYEEEKNLAVFLNTSEFEVYIELHVWVINERGTDWKMIVGKWSRNFVGG